MAAVPSVACRALSSLEEAFVQLRTLAALAAGLAMLAIGAAAAPAATPATPYDTIRLNPF